MVDLIQPQIQEGCKLALPEGLTDLMSDISREVLRAQPQDPYKFIADYLSAMMVARENLSIASRLCDSTCTSTCKPELEDELRYIGLEDEDASKAKEIIEKYFEQDEVNEQNLMIQLAKKTSIDELRLPMVQGAIRKAYQRHLINDTVIFESSSDSDQDDVAHAVKHTLHLYRKTKHSPEEYALAATRVQAAYRAYGVRRPSPMQESGGLTEQEHEDLGPSTTHKDRTHERNIQFSADINSGDEMHGPFKACLPTASSSSLAGSYMHLPKFIPYTAHEPQVLERDEAQKESNSALNTDGEHSSGSGQKKISFLESTQETIEDKANLADDESETSVEEVITETEEVLKEAEELILEEVDEEDIEEKLRDYSF